MIMHVNRPAGATAEGLTAAVSQLRSTGIEFVTLSGAGGLA
ncbi:hypothetical protein [Rhodococcus sp. 3A]|nr:hypothetical protein [Rhodococcus sp. 3A]